LPDETNIIANVNPITTAIRVRAEALGLSPASIIQADAEMADELLRLVGVVVPPNIPTIPYVDIVNGSTGELADSNIATVAVNISLFHAGLISLISDNSGHSTIDEVVDSLAAGFALTGNFGVSDNFNSGEVQAVELLFAMEQQIRTLVEEQPGASDVIQNIAPENDLQVLADALEELGNGIASVPPEISGTPSTSATEDVAYIFTPRATDADVGDVLSFSINKVMATELPWATFSLETGTLTGVPTNADVGVVNGIVITVTDSAGESASLDSFNLTIVNEPLVISGSPETSAVEDVAYVVFTPTVSDLADVESFSIQNKPSWATFNQATGKLEGTPTNEDVGDHTSIIISVTDGNETSTLPPFNISVTNVNDPPVISGSPPAEILIDDFFTFTPIVEDIDNPGNPDPLTFSITNQPAWADVAFNTATGELSGTPEGADIGTVNDVMITVSDGLATDTLTFSISVDVAEYLPTGWIRSFIDGGVRSIVSSSIGYEPALGEFSISHTGGEIWATADHAQMATYRVDSLSDFTLTACVSSHHEGTAAVYPKAGVMLRETLDPQSPYLYLNALGPNGVKGRTLSGRSSAGLTSTAVASDTTPVALPEGFRLEVDGDLQSFKAYTSADCTSGWTEFASGNASWLATGSALYSALACTVNDESDVGLSGSCRLNRVTTSTDPVDHSPPLSSGSWTKQMASGCSDTHGSFDAFIPGMRGFGSCTRGGFVPGTTVHVVRNTNPTGNDSLAAAVNAACPKVILFGAATGLSIT
jgi:hypothetical protein